MTTETTAPALKGWRTLAINGAIAIGAAALTWAAGVNWTDYVSPTVALIVTSAVNVGLRVITSTPVGKAA